MNNSYESVAQSFLDDHPLGTVVSGSKLVNWAESHPDGTAIKPDLAIADPGKRLSTLRRHLNLGASSDIFPEDRRFQLQVEDAVRKIYVVRPLSEVVTEQATDAVGKSIMGALNPLKNSRRAIDRIKLDELPELERTILERAHANITAMEAVIKPTYAQEVERIWIAEMAHRGISADQAKIIRDALPQLSKIRKLLDVTS